MRRLGNLLDRLLGPQCRLCHFRADDRPHLARHIDRCHTDVQLRQFWEARR